MSKIFDQWNLYSRILANNYMRHVDLSVVLREDLTGLDRTFPRDKFYGSWAFVAEPVGA